MNKSNGESGFTLIELMVVVAIIGILAAVAIPSFIEKLREARNQKAATEVNSTQTAIDTCLANSCDFTTIDFDDAIIVKCQTCSDPDSDYEGTITFVSSSDLTINVNQNPMWGKYLIAGFHEKGTKTYCLHNPPLYKEIYADELNVSLCDTLTPPFSSF